MRIDKGLGYVLLLLMLSACVNIFDPEVNDGSGALVVSGMMTDFEEIQYVNITRTRPITQSTDHPGVSGAVVRILDDQGLIITLQEQSPGTYATPTVVKGEIGRSYHVEIDLDGRHYESEPEQIQKPAEIAAIKASFKNNIVLPGTTDAIQNEVAFYVDVRNDEPGTSKFYKYDWDATYKIEVPFRNDVHLCEGATDDSPFIPFCYASESSGQFLNILSMNDHASSVYRDHLLMTVAPNIRFMLRYSIQVKQYSMTLRAFRYWDDIITITGSTGSLFDPPPTRIRGNMKSTSHPKENVLGYFMASAVVRKREFFTPEVVPIPLLNFNTCVCYPRLEICRPDNIPEDKWVPEITKPYCCDCSYYPNSEVQKPDFWID